MKYRYFLIAAVFFFSAYKSNGQTLDTTWHLTFNSVEMPTTYRTITPDTVPTKIVFYSKEINNEIFQIRPNGDIYYTPRFFCNCDSCKSFKGMKFLMNFLNPQK
jgi:hypothetical protein